MGALFGKSKSNKSGGKSKRRNDEMSEKDKAALQVKRQRDRLIKYEKQMMAKIERETEICLQDSRTESAPCEVKASQEEGEAWHSLLSGAPVADWPCHLGYYWWRLSTG